MKHRILFEYEFEGDTKKIAMVGEAWGGGETDELQLQVEQNGNEAYIDLNLKQAKMLFDNLKEWLTIKGILTEEAK